MSVSYIDTMFVCLSCGGFFLCYRKGDLSFSTSPVPGSKWIKDAFVCGAVSLGVTKYARDKARRDKESCTNS